VALRPSAAARGVDEGRDGDAAALGERGQQLELCLRRRVPASGGRCESGHQWHSPSPLESVQARQAATITLPLERVHLEQSMVVTFASPMHAAEAINGNHLRLSKACITLKLSARCSLTTRFLASAVLTYTYTIHESVYQLSSCGG